MAKANDTFVESGADVSLASHTPTGADAGASWQILFSGGVSVIAANDNATDTNSSEGNRVRMTTDLGYDQMDVQADFTSNGSAGEFVFFGLIGRAPGSGSNVFIEFTYEFSQGANGGWRIVDGVNEVSFDEAWLGGVVTVKLQVRKGDIRGFANGVEKVRLFSDGFSGNTRAGFLLGNFTGTANRITIDNYQSEGLLIPQQGYKPVGMFFGQ